MRDFFIQTKFLFILTKNKHCFFFFVEYCIRRINNVQNILRKTFIVQKITSFDSNLNNIPKK